MADVYSYKATEGKERLKARSFRTFPATESVAEKSDAKRVFVPFTGFDGQSLAGTGALVFEGELLTLRNH